jgi:hypothetical protein
MRKTMMMLAMMGAVNATEISSGPTDEQLKIAALVRSVADTTREKPVVVEGATVIRVVAYAHSDNEPPCIDEKVIMIPEGWQYYSHSCWPLSTYGEWKVHDLWADADQNNPNKVGAIHCKVEALPDWKGPSWVGVQMDVVLVPEKTQ